MSDDDRLLDDSARLVRRLLERTDVGDGTESLYDALAAYLDAPPDRMPMVAEDVTPFRMVDLDLALSDLADRDPDSRVIGIGGGDQRHHMSFGDLIARGRFGAGVRVGQVDYATKPTGPGEHDHRNVVAEGIRLLRFAGAPVAVRVQDARQQYGRNEALVTVLTAERATAEALLVETRRRMDEHSVLRGKVVTFTADAYRQGMSGITYVERPTLTRDDLVLPQGVLERVSDHVVGIALRREELRRHGQHLKRGVLLYGPPGTGKTHTMRYLISASPGTTAILLSGGSLQYIHAAAQIARAHQPALVVLEDCDLIADDRSFGPPGTKPLLFEVLDAMDGLDGDADVTFLLTTNRVADLERALVQRPGRVDLAAEIPLPDETARAALIRLYARGLFSEDAVIAAARGSDGTTASFAKELVRRAVLKAGLDGAEPGDSQLAQVLEELMSDGERLTRSLLGSGSEDPDQAPGPFGPHGPHQYPPPPPMARFGPRGR